MGTDAVDTDTTTYQFDIDRDTWREWADTVPRSVPLYARLRTLIEMDTHREDIEDVTTTRLVTMQYNRIQQRCETATEALERGDADKVREELAAIAEVADAFAD